KDCFGRRSKQRTATRSPQPNGCGCIVTPSAFGSSKSAPSCCGTVFPDRQSYSRRKLCTLAAFCVFRDRGQFMPISQHGRFVRFPSALLDALSRARLSSAEVRILLWVIRRTYGWNRNRARFTWYGMAKDLKANRGTVFRAGARLLHNCVLR